MTILEIELESATNLGEIEYGELKFAEIDNPLLEDYERAFRDYFKNWI